MLFSSKITNSVLTYIEKKGVATGPLIEQIERPVEFLRDPSCWIHTSEMEEFLSSAEHLFVDEVGEDRFLESVGASAAELHSWGVLDSVLKMMDSASEIFFQPDRFLSYFISPPPPVGSLAKTHYTVKFQLPMTAEEYPYTARYLMGAVEGLPKYFGAEAATIKWRESEISIAWDDGQKSLFGDEDPGRNISPQFMQDIVSAMEQSQHDLEEKNRELSQKNHELEKAKEALEKSFQQKIHAEKLMGVSELAVGMAHEINSPIGYVMSNVRRLQDYMVRAQQLVTLLVAQDRMDPQVRRAMQKVDWEYIQGEFPETVKDSLEGLVRIQEIVKDLSFLAESGELNANQKTPSNLNKVVQSAINSTSPSIPSSVRIDQHLLCDEELSMDSVRMEQALINLINNAVQSIKGDGAVRIIARPKGDKAEIEISDTGGGMDEGTIENIFTPFYTTNEAGSGTGLGLSIAHSIVKMHEGNITVNSEKGRGSTFLIELPH